MFKSDSASVLCSDMKRFILSLFLVFCAFSTWGQDVIMFRNGSEVTVKVIEITGRTVIYQELSGMGTMNEVSQSEVFSITYANGEKETFKVVADNPSDYPYPKTTRTYKIGDVFDSDFVQGIVIYTTDGGRHGLILAMNNIFVFSWCYINDYGATAEEGLLMDATDKNDGWKNYRRIASIISASSLKWSNFGAFNACRALGDGWYLPAYNEMNCVFNLCGYSNPPTDKRAFKKALDEINAVLKSLGADRLYTPYCTSTEADAHNVFFWEPHNQEEWTKGRKSQSVNLRPVHKF